MLKISDDLALIFTTDFFTPIVDDPYSFGAIAAANSISDIYATGGRPVLALNIACFPKNLPDEVMIAILRGGAEKTREAGAIIAGGHTVDDDEPKFGLAVIGFAHPNRLLEKHSARPGDHLFLTKPLGSGLITTALKASLADPAHVSEATRWMATLNRTASVAALASECVSATDITGFGFTGHALEIASKSRVRLTIDSHRLPFMSGARDYAAQWLFPAGANRNRKAEGDRVIDSGKIAEELRMLLACPETSGGLLVAVPESGHARFIESFRLAGGLCWEIGRVESGEGLRID